MCRLGHRSAWGHDPSRMLRLHLCVDVRASNMSCMTYLMNRKEINVKGIQEIGSPTSLPVSIRSPRPIQRRIPSVMRRIININLHLLLKRQVKELLPPLKDTIY